MARNGSAPIARRPAGSDAFQEDGIEFSRSRSKPATALYGFDTSSNSYDALALRYYFTAIRL